jgi:intracellular septation protein A
MQELLLNNWHFMDSLEGHAENRWYHFYLLSQQYGGLIVFFVILPGLFYFLRTMQHKTMKIAVVTWLGITYVFFTIAATKMPMFCAIVSPLIFLALGSILEIGIRKFREYLPARKYIFVLVLMLGYLAYDNLSINTLDKMHSDNESRWKEWRTNAIINKYVAERIPSPDYVIFNSGGLNSIMLMFYSNNTVYGFYPDKRQYLALKSAGTKIAVFLDEKVPDFLKKDSAVLKIHLQVKPY